MPPMEQPMRIPKCKQRQCPRSRAPHMKNPLLSLVNVRLRAERPEAPRDPSVTIHSLP